MARGAALRCIGGLQQTIGPENRRALYAGTERIARRTWVQIVFPLATLAQLRLSMMLRALPSCSFRNVAVLLLTSAVLTSASQIMSPGALPRPAEASGSGGAEKTESERSADYAWLSREQRERYVPLVERIAAPPGFERVAAQPGSFADWLRHFPAAAEGSPVKRYDGKLGKGEEAAGVAAVLELQPKSRLLDAARMMLRLRAEHGWSAGDRESIAFHLNSGELVSWPLWSAGIRPVVSDRTVRFAAVCGRDEGRSNFCRYLESLFALTSSESLLDDTRPAASRGIAAGDLFLEGEGGGRVLIVVDVAADEAGGLRLLLAAGGVPAETLHVIRGPDEPGWFPFGQNGAVWSTDGACFSIEHLRHWVR